MVRVVAVVVRVGVLVVDFGVLVPMGVALGRVEPEAEEHRRSRDRRDDADGLPEERGDQGRNERRRREDRCGARGPDASLGEDVEAEAGAVAGRAAGEEAARGKERW